MSNSALTWALRQQTDKPSDKWVLAVQANAARDAPHQSRTTGRMWPPLHAYQSIASLCEVTQLDRKTVIKALARLEARGLIRPAGHDGQTSQVVVYQLMVNSGATGTPHRSERSVRSGTVSSPKKGTAFGRLPDVKAGGSSSPENGTCTKTGTVPFSERNGTAISPEQSHYPDQPVPKTGHEANRNLFETIGKTKTNAARLPHLLTEYPDLLKDVDRQVLEDWLALRRQRRALVTRTVLTVFAREAAAAGITIGEAMAICCARSWQGFKAEWVIGNPPSRFAGRQATTRGGGSQAVRRAATLAGLTGTIEPEKRSNDATSTSSAIDVESRLVQP